MPQTPITRFAMARPLAVCWIYIGSIGNCAYWLFDAIERIEVALRTQIIYHFSLRHGSDFFQKKSLYRNQPNFKSDLKVVDKEISRSSEVFIKHYKAKYTNPKRPPSWMTLEILSLGTLSKIFENLRISPEKKLVSAHFGLNTFVLESWMHTLSHVRNICAHHGRLWNRTLTQVPKIPSSASFLWVKQAGASPDRLYPTICAIQYLLNTIAPGHRFGTRIKALLEEYPNIDLGGMGFPKDWKDDVFWQSEP